MAARVERCLDCGAQWGPGVLACPSCHRLVHGAALSRLAGEAARCAKSSDEAGELERWRRALALLPPASKQAQRIGERVKELEARSPAPAAQKASPVPKWLASLGALGVFLWKAKAILLFLATKAKLLAAGFASWQTMLSMALALGVYWTAFGWPYALGLIVSLYIHEIGHVIALRHYGIPASAPMFLPGIGAIVRLDRHPETPQQDARVGLAGPLFGLGAALVAYALFLATGHAILGAIARTGAWINLFNLIPVWQLDGGRGFASLTRGERALATAATASAWLLSSEPLLIVVSVGAAYRTLLAPAPNSGDRVGLAHYVALLAALTGLAMIDVPASSVP